MTQQGSAKARRTAARLAAVQVLYQMKLNSQDASSALRDYAAHHAGAEIDGGKMVPPETAMLDSIVTGVQHRWSDIDAVIAKSLADGGRGGVETLLECILRAGVYELLAHGEIDSGIIINDYLNVTSGFYAGSEPKLVNGILDRVAKSVRG